MWRLGMVAVAAALISPTAAAGQDYTFGDWARDKGYSPGDVMPSQVWARSSSIDSLDSIGEFDWTTKPTIMLFLYGNQISSIESGAFSGMTNLVELGLGENEAMRELNLEAADFSSLLYFDVGYSAKISSVSLRNAAVNQTALAAMFYGGSDFMIGIQELNNKWHRITEMDLSGINFANITDLRPFYGMDDLTDLWLVKTANLDATDLDVLLDNLETIEGTDTEGILHMTRADFDAFNTFGSGLLAAWDAEPGHHVAFVIPEPSTLLLVLVTLGVIGGWRKLKRAT